MHAMIKKGMFLWKQMELKDLDAQHNRLGVSDKAINCVDSNY